MRRLEHDRRRTAGIERFAPARCAEAPAITGLEAGELVEREWCREVVATRFGEGEKLVGQHHTDGMHALVLPARVTAAVAIEARNRIVRACL